jgi:hypothetical protein
MRSEDGKITCDGCSKDVTAMHLMCDELQGEWCRECFGDCPCPPEQSCHGKDEGCPTCVCEIKDGNL